MAKEKSAHSYELELRRMVKARTGKDCEVWLYPLIRTLAHNMVVRDKMESEILGMNALVSCTTGSTGQTKTEVTPLLSLYDKAQRTITQQLSALSLTFDATPSKITENTKQGGAGHDNLRDMLESMNGRS